jgi:hypothetical protein
MYTRTLVAITKSTISVHGFVKGNLLNEFTFQFVQLFLNKKVGSDSTVTFIV